MSAQTEFMPSTTAMELSRFASDGRDVPRDTQPLWGLLELEAEFCATITSLSPSPTDQDFCDGGGLSRPCATSYTVTTPTSDLMARGNLQEARRVSFADENKSDGKGQICMDPITGELGLTDGTTTGEIFSMEHKFWIDGKKGECFLLRSSSNPFFYLALDSSSSDFAVRGMRLANLKDDTDCYWTYVFYYKLCRCSTSKRYISLRYYGDRFGDPSKAPHYLIIEPKDKAFTFTIGTPEKAVQHGALGPFLH